MWCWFLKLSNSILGVLDGNIACYCCYIANQTGCSPGLGVVPIVSQSASLILGYMTDNFTHELAKLSSLFSASRKWRYEVTPILEVLRRAQTLQNRSNYIHGKCLKLQFGTKMFYYVCRTLLVQCFVLKNNIFPDFAKNDFQTPCWRRCKHSIKVHKIKFKNTKHNQ